MEIKLIRKLRWEEVFCFWYQNEGQKENWAELAKERGFASWADWRLSGYADRFECQKADWGLYEIFDPAGVILDFFGGPFRTWIENNYDGEKTKSFAELAERDEIVNKTAVKSMSENFPQDSIITCLDLSGKIFVIEGMHRACALAVMRAQGKKTPEKLLFAIGKSQLKELPPVGKNSVK